MSQLTVTLPDTLQQELSALAQFEGVPLNQYILYALTRQVALAYRAWKLPEANVQTQQGEFSALLAQLGEASPQAVQQVLQEREPAPAESELSKAAMRRLQEKLLLKQPGRVR